MTSLSELVIVASEEPWRRFGLEIHSGAAVVAGVTFRFVADEHTPGIIAWGLDDLPDDRPAEHVGDIDGIRTFCAAPPEPMGDSDLQVTDFDHLVVRTSDLERTCSAIEAATGAPLKRIREAGEVRQGFHRFGPVIIEVVEHASISAATAQLWGIALTVADVDAECARLGPDLLGAPKSAVQAGRSIATVRDAMGLGVPVALMSSDRPR